MSPGSGYGEVEAPGQEEGSQDQGAGQQAPGHLGGLQSGVLGFVLASCTAAPAWLPWTSG